MEDFLDPERTDLLINLVFMNRTKLNYYMAVLRAGRTLSTKKKSLSGRARDYASKCYKKNDIITGDEFMKIHARAIEVELLEKEQCEEYGWAFDFAIPSNDPE